MCKIRFTKWKNLIFIILLLLLLCGGNYKDIIINHLHKITVTNQEKLNLILFTATWCGPCKKLKKDLHNEKIQQLISTNYKLYVIDIDKKPRYSKTYNVNLIPTLIISKKLPNNKSKVIKRMVGYKSTNQLLNFLSKE